MDRAQRKKLFEQLVAKLTKTVEAFSELEPPEWSHDEHLRFRMNALEAVRDLEERTRRITYHASEWYSTAYCRVCGSSCTNHNDREFSKWLAEHEAPHGKELEGLAPTPKP